MSKKNIIAFAILMLILLGLYAGSVYLRDRNNQQKSDYVTTPSETSDHPQAQNQSQQNIKLEYLKNYSDETGWGPNGPDGKIIQTNLADGKQKTLVPSIKQAYKPLQAQFNLGLELVSYKGSGGEMYFTEVLYDTDSPANNLIKYDAGQNNFTRLKVSSYYQDFHAKAVSPSSPFAVSSYNPQNISDERSLFLLDLDNDKATTLLKLPNTQTFNLCWEDNCFGGNQGEIEWVSAKEFVVSIYDPNTSQENEYGWVSRKLIEKRKITIP